ncbi:MAG: DnaD domain protein [Clostridiales bacterium]|nr:DnaD domain protein [Clostridiales bacterium]
MSGTDLNQLLLSDTSIEDLFICQYMAGLSKEAICIYLLLKMDGKGKYSLKDVEERSIFQKQATEEAMAELIAAGLLAKNKSDNFVFVDIKKEEIDSYCAGVIARGGADLSDLELSPLKKERDDLCNSISKTVYAGKMGYVFYRLVDRCLFRYEFESIVIYKLFLEAKERKIQYDYRAVEKIAEEWNKEGIRTAEKVDQVLKSRQKVEEIIQLVGRITRKRQNEYDLERIEKWAGLNLSPELIEYAYRANEYRGITSKNVDETLSNWVLAGIKTVDEASKYEAEVHKENTKKYKGRKNKEVSGGRSGSEAGITYVGNSEEDSKSSVKKENKDIFDLFGGNEDEND